MQAGAVTTGTASYNSSLIFLQSAGPGSNTIHSAPKAIQFYVDNHDTAAGSGTNYGQYGDLAMTIAESTRVGIGTASPSSLLHLSSASSPTLRIVDTTNSVTLLAYAQDSSARFGTYSNHDLIFDSNSTERMRIASGGNVGIGTTSPSAKLHVNGTAKATKLELDESGSTTGDVSSPAGFIDVIVGGTGYIIPYFSPE